MITRQKNCPVCQHTDLSETDHELRDSKELKVLKCHNCEHVFLESFEHIDDDYFVSSDFLLSKPVAQGVESRRRHYSQENKERAERMRPLVVNKRVLDFGGGAGTLMTRLAPLCEVIHGVEPTASFNEALREEGYTIFQDTETHFSCYCFLRGHHSVFAKYLFGGIPYRDSAVF